MRNCRILPFAFVTLLLTCTFIHSPCRADVVDVETSRLQAASEFVVQVVAGAFVADGWEDARLTSRWCSTIPFGTPSTTSFLS